MRNLIITIASVPDAYKKNLSVVMNDDDPDVIARNAVLLLVNLLNEDEDDAVDLTLHLWYSAFLKRKHIDLLAGTVRLIVKKVLEDIQGKHLSEEHSERWIFGRNSLNLVLKKEHWNRMLSLCSAPISLSSQTWQNIRRDGVLSKGTEQEKQDYFEQRLANFSPKHRAAKKKFQEDGILLPFGHSRVGFVQPNPTLFRNGRWTIRDGEDPSDGWNLPRILEYPIPIQNDLYGKLYFYLKGYLRHFHRQLRMDRQHKFQLLNVDAVTLRTNSHIMATSFARIETANIADTVYCRLDQTLEHLSPLLQKPSENRHATMLTLFMNAVGEQRQSMPEQATNAIRTAERELLHRYIPIPQRTRRAMHGSLFYRNDFWFDQCVQNTPVH